MLKITSVLLQLSTIFFVIVFHSASAAKSEEIPVVTNLRTEYKVNPLGIDAVNPRLSWEIISKTRRFVQNAYQVRTALSTADLTNNKNLLWDSGKIISSESNQVVYKGPSLKSREKIYWQVMIWGEDGTHSDWSEPSWWEMGLLSASDWKAKWIEPALEENKDIDNPCPYLRKEFSLNKEIKSARAYVTAHGLYEFHLNGEKISDQLFTPGWTSYNKRLQYQVYDITEKILADRNAIGIILADGWYRGPLKWDKKRNNYGDELALLMQIIIEYQDGTSETIVSDNSWKTATGPILISEIYDGELYDARLEKSGWDKPGYKDLGWSGTTEKNYPSVPLIASEGPAVRITESIKPINKFKTPNGDLVFDLGQNMVGWIQFKLKGNPGEKIIMKHAEVLDHQGNIYTANLRQAKQTVEYIFKGVGIETYEPHFTFQGFRYVAVTGYTGEISLDDLTGKVIHSDMTPSGNFACSDSLINQLQKNIQWGLRGNFLDVPTDCPQRDERLGWTGDAQVFAPTACFNMDAASFYTKWMKDFIADQLKEGQVPHVIPDLLLEGGAAGWADAAVIVPWTVYLNYGDKRILETQYESMQKWINYLKAKAGASYIWKRDVGYGDWLAYSTPWADYPGATTDRDLIGTAYFYHSTSLLQKIALILGKDDDAKVYGDLISNIKAAFLREFVTENGRLASNTQTAYVLALDFDLLPENLKSSAAKRLADDVDNFGHITTGFLGTAHLCKILSDYGYIDQAYKLLFRREYPSWLYPVTKGATTIWERWDGIKSDGSFQDVGMNSFNHYAYGAVGKWLYSSVAGIELDQQIPGYKKIIMNPLIPAQLSFAKAEYHSIYGNIAIQWKNQGKSIMYEVEVPANTTADIYIQADGIEKIYENGKKVDTNMDIQFIKTVGDKTVLNIGSGKYQFEVRK